MTLVRVRMIDINGHWSCWKWAEQKRGKASLVFRIITATGSPTNQVFLGQPEDVEIRPAQMNLHYATMEEIE